MAAIKEAIMLQDRMSPVLRSVAKAISSTIRSMENADKATSQAFKAAQQDARAAEAAMREYDEALNDIKPPPDVSSSIDSWGKKLAMVTAAAYATKKALSAIGSGIQSVLDYSDKMSMSAARIHLVNDGQQTDREVQDMIFEAAANANTGYDGMAELVTKTGMFATGAFTGIEEVVDFSEIVAKAFKVGGASTEEMNGSMRQLNQALASGVLRGDELNSIMEQAPSIAKAIEQYINSADLNPDNLSLREFAAEGNATAQIVRDALFWAKDDIQKAYEELPNTFSNVGTAAQREFDRAFRPVGDMLSNMLNSDVGAAYQAQIGGIADAAASGVMSFIGHLVEMQQKNAAFLAGNMLLWDKFVDKVLYVKDTVVLYWQQMGNGMEAATQAATIGVLDHMSNMVNGIVDAINWAIDQLNKLGANIDRIDASEWAITLAADAYREKAATSKAENEAIEQALREKRDSDSAKRLERAEELYDERMDNVDKTYKALTDAIETAQKDDGKTGEQKFGSGLGGDPLQENGRVGSVGKIEDDVTISEEDIKLLKDVASREYQIRYTQLTPSLTANFGDFHNTADPNAILGTMVAWGNEALASSLHRG